MAEPPPPPSALRAQRLAQALRANLRRRKASAAALAPTREPGDTPRLGDGEEPR